MAVIQHSAISDAELHQPKGASTAVVNSTIKSDGAGATSWSKISPPNLSGLTTNGSVGQHIDSNGDGTFTMSYTPHGSIHFANIGAPYVQAYAAAYAKIGATTTVSASSIDFTEATTNRLTYTGATHPHFRVVWMCSLDQSVGANRDISVAVYKNGVVLSNSEGITTTTSGNKVMVTGLADVDLATNDYLELWIFNRGGGGNMNIYTMSLMVAEQ